MSSDGFTFERSPSGETGPDLAAQVANLIYSLRARGLTADSRQAIAVEQLLLSLQPRWHEPEFDLAAHVGPIFCRSVEEQRRFRDIVSGLPLLKRQSPRIAGVEHATAGVVRIPSDVSVPRRKPGQLIPVIVALSVLIVGAIWCSLNVPPGRTVTEPSAKTPKQPMPGNETPGIAARPIVDSPVSAPARLLSYHRIMLRKPLAKPSEWSWVWASLPLVGLLGWFLHHRGKRPRLRRESTNLAEVFREVRLPGGPRDPLSRLRVRELSRSLRIRQKVASRELHTDFSRP